MKKSLLALALGAIVGSAAFAADDAAANGGAPMPEKKVTIDTVPAAVKDGINGALDGGTIKSIAEVKKEGKTAYKVQIEKDGKVANKWFDEKGAVMEKDKGKHEGDEKGKGDEKKDEHAKDK